MSAAETTPAVVRGAHAAAGLTDEDVTVNYWRDLSAAVLAAALEGDTIAEVLALHEDLVWQEPGEVFECVGCDYRVPGDEVEARTIRWHQQDMIRTELLGEARDDAGEADPGLLLVVLGVLGAVVLGAVVVAAAAGVLG